MKKIIRRSFIALGFMSGLYFGVYVLFIGGFVYLFQNPGLKGVMGGTTRVLASGLVGWGLVYAGSVLAAFFSRDEEMLQKLLKG